MNGCRSEQQSSSCALVSVPIPTRDVLGITGVNAGLVCVTEKECVASAASKMLGQCSKLCVLRSSKTDARERVKCEHVNGDASDLNISGEGTVREGSALNDANVPDLHVAAGQQTNAEHSVAAIELTGPTKRERVVKA